MPAKFQTRLSLKRSLRKMLCHAKTLENYIHKNEVSVVEDSKEKITLSKYCSFNVCILSGDILISP